MQVKEQGKYQVYSQLIADVRRLGEVVVTPKTVEVSILSDGGMCAIPVPFDPLMLES